MSRTSRHSEIAPNHETVGGVQPTQDTRLGKWSLACHFARTPLTFSRAPPRRRAGVAPTSLELRADFLALDVARTPCGFSRAPPRASQETPAFPFSATTLVRRFVI